MALFGRKKPDEPGPPEDKGGSSDVIQPDPEKAKVFFDRARTVHDTANFEYAMTLWLQGLRKDPTDLQALEHLLQSGGEFSVRKPGRPGPTKEQSQQFGGKGKLEKHLANLLNWAARPLDWQVGLKAMESAVELELRDAARWIGMRVFALALEDPRTKKDHYVSLMENFQAAESFDMATKAGERAIREDPTDAKLEANVRNMSAQATMAKGGFEESGQAGGYRRNVRDIEKQRALEEEERLVKSESTLEAVIARAQADYESRPTDPSAIKKYAKHLLERGTPEDEKAAYKLLMDGFEATNAYEFRKLAGDLQLRVARRKVREVVTAAKAEPSNEELRKKAVAAQRKLAEAEVKEFEERVANYPTDMALRYDLGKRYFELGQYEGAIEHFQQAKSVASIANQVRNLLGQSFLRIGWMDEAEGTFREALESHENHNDQLGLELRYGLMDALESKARDRNDAASADEAFRLASGIAIQAINFKDIRERRQKLNELVKELKTTA